ncbi:MAG: polyphenol oxidase family protein [Candidatus Kerfeldbacteria bacterium]|nr:polyphenol oxidase family protein [Candidatus Kerfeldbacteria bacterium]
MAIFMTGQRIERATAAWHQAFSGKNVPFVYHLTTVEDGNMSYRYGSEEAVVANRRKVFSSLGLSAGDVLPLSLDLSHGVHWLDTAPANDGLAVTGFRSEGLWLAKPAKALFMFVADCFPIAAFDPISGALGVFHAGRAELEAGLLQRFFAAAVERGLKPKNVRVFIGPGICPVHYVFQKLPDGHGGASRQDADGVWHVDLREDIRLIMKKVGISDNNIV